LLLITSHGTKQKSRASTIEMHEGRHSHFIVYVMQMCNNLDHCTILITLKSFIKMLGDCELNVHNLCQLCTNDHSYVLLKCSILISVHHSFAGYICEFDFEPSKGVQFSY